MQWTSLQEEAEGLAKFIKARELAQSAGFGHFRRLPIEHPFSALYELKVQP